ncbi:MAG: preprotein translocase subunit SecA, partial [Candidatus Gracilibacteria bacterium]
MITKLLQKILGDYNLKEIRKLEPVVEYINKLEEGYQKDLKDEDIPLKTEEFKKRIATGEPLDTILPEAFALVKNACRKLVGKKWEVRGREMAWDMIPYDVQIIGGLVLHHGKIAEMKTGEGKTLVCTMPLYLNALTGKGTHLVTVNSYLANRDSEWMGGLYKFLGLTVGVIEHGQSHQDKQAAYNCDITYGTNNEFGFDYLRDNMVRTLNQCVQRELNYSIVDEVDSILIDEARTPLIISAPAEESTSKYMKYAGLISALEENKHYTIDEKIKTAILSEDGIKKMEELLGMENIYTEGGFQEVNHIEQALKAHTVYKKDVDYMVKDGEVIIVDSFTGRLMPGRRYSAGLHQAIEAKERVEVKRESKTMATITFQNYFRMYKKLAGMTGTALTEAEEFAAIYNLNTISIPTNKPVKRLDRPDAIYKNHKGKYMAIAEKTKELHQKGQPVLIGTVSIEKSELLSGLLKAQGIKHEVLNAKQHEKEAEIVSKAGQKGSVTIATNMAGRGTDIKLGEGIGDLGGLYIMGTERHESRRIDNQLRGRAGRQGDNGETQFYISMEDDLMRLFGADSIKKMMEFLRVPDDMMIENKRISKSIENAQKSVEGRHFDIRKHLVDYDDIMNKHREIMYRR